MLGTNGAGKITTISILTTLLQPDSGTATVAGHDVVSAPAAVRQAISMTGQNVTVELVLTGLENLALIARLRHVPDPKHVAAELIERFGLAEAADKPTATYSGGMKRRLDIAMVPDRRAAGHLPRRADHRPGPGRPAGGLGHGRGPGLDRHHDHADPQYMEEPAHLADTIAVLARGRITASGSHDDILEEAGAADLESAFLALTAEGAHTWAP